MTNPSARTRPRPPQSIVPMMIVIRTTAVKVGESNLLGCSGHVA
jgi:hypothetical protein